MELITINQDITVYYVEARAFPDGILEAHQQLHALIPFSGTRNYYGLSRPENGGIKYKAAAEKFTSDHVEKLKGNIIAIKKGKYVCLTVNNYMENIQGIGHAFEKLLAYPGLDPHGYCVEWYHTAKDVKCMIRLEQDLS